MSFRPDNWDNPYQTDYDPEFYDVHYAFEAGANAMCKAKDEARRPVKEVRLKLIDVDWGDMSMSEFVDWMYGEVER